MSTQNFFKNTKTLLVATSLLICFQVKAQSQTPAPQTVKIQMLLSTLNQPVIDAQGKVIGFIGRSDDVKKDLKRSKKVKNTVLSQNSFEGAVIEVEVPLQVLLSAAANDKSRQEILNLSKKGSVNLDEIDGDRLFKSINMQKIIAAISTYKLQTNKKVLQQITILEPGNSKKHIPLFNQKSYVNLSSVKNLKSMLQFEGFQVGASLIQEQENFVVSEEQDNLPDQEAVHKDDKTEASVLLGKAEKPCYCSKNKEKITKLTPTTVSDETVKKYSESSAVKSSIMFAKKIKRAKSTGNCYRFVKEELLSSGLIDKYPAGKKYKSAKDAGFMLHQQGFINLMDDKKYSKKIKSPYNAPEGSVLVYAGGKDGHIEIKTDDGFISDYPSSMARTGDAKNGKVGLKRQLIGVYIKPM